MASTNVSTTFNIDSFTNFGIRENGVPATAAAIQLSPGANAISTASDIRARLTELPASGGRRRPAI
jgi:multidrug efflux pump subunit AcrB